MASNGKSGNVWHVVKTRLRDEERDYVDRVAEADGRSVASVLRRLVRESMARSEQEEAA